MPKAKLMSSAEITKSLTVSSSRSFYKNCKRALEQGLRDKWRAGITRRRLSTLSR